MLHRLLRDSSSGESHPPICLYYFVYWIFLKIRSFSLFETSCLFEFVFQWTLTITQRRGLILAPPYSIAGMLHSHVFADALLAKLGLTAPSWTRDIIRTTCLCFLARACHVRRHCAVSQVCLFTWNGLHNSPESSWLSQTPISESWAVTARWLGCWIPIWRARKPYEKKL